MNFKITSPSRLHFGLFAVGDQVERSFGGVGLMVRSPGTTIQTRPANEFVVLADGADGDGGRERVKAVEKYAQLWLERFGDELPKRHSSIASLPVELNVVEASPRHVGLGSGTQLALLTGLSLQQFFGLPTPKSEELSAAMHRAGRSAIGTFGCFEGGLLVDRGKTASELVSPIDLRIDFPEHWPVAIVRVAGTGAEYPAGLHGADEEAVFKEIAPTSPRQLEEMRALVSEQLVPGVLSENYDQFAEAVCEFGRRSGEYFAAVQGGPYAGATISDVVKTCLDLGVSAVGQSSWGPSVFAIGESREQLEPAVRKLKQTFGERCQVDITCADNRGVQVQEQLPSEV